MICLSVRSSVRLSWSVPLTHSKLAACWFVFVSVKVEAVHVILNVPVGDKRPSYQPTVHTRRGTCISQTQALININEIK